MENKIDLKFCNLIYSNVDKDIDFVVGLLRKAYNVNKKFFKINIPKFKIQLVYSREEFDKLWGSKTQDFISAFVKGETIIIFAYDIFNKETKWEKKEFYNTLVHEINHLFYQELRDDEYDPLWLSEGLATFMQHEQKKADYREKLEITPKILEQKCNEMTLENYQILTLFTEYLILNFGKEKILKLILGLKEGNDLNTIFQEIYEQSFEELIKNANKYH